MTDRQKVLAWLTHIKEVDQKIIDEVIEQCKTDPSARKYYLMRYEEDVLDIQQPHLVAA